MSAPLLTRKKVLQVKIEATKGTAETLTLIDALVFDPIIQPTAEYIERKGSGKFLGHTSDGVLGEQTGVLTCSAELRSNGSATMDTGVDAMLTACGFENNTDVFTPESAPANMKTLTAILYEDGVKKVLYGAMGNVEFVGEIGKRCLLNFEFMGKWTAPTDAAMPAYAPSATSPAMFKSGSFTFGGTGYNVSAFNLNLNNTVVPRLQVSDATGVDWFCITDRDPTLSCDPELQLVADIDFHGQWLAGTEQAVSIACTDGTDTVTISIPKFQISEAPEGDRDGILTHELVGKCNIDSGDDEISIATT